MVAYGETGEELVNFSLKGVEIGKKLFGEDNYKVADLLELIALYQL